MSKEDFDKLNGELLRSDISVEFIGSLAQKFPQLKKAYLDRLDKDLTKFAEEGRTDLLEEAEEQDLLEDKTIEDYLGYFLVATYAFHDETAKWLLAEIAELLEEVIKATPKRFVSNRFTDEVSQAPLTSPHAIELILREIVLAKDQRLELATLAFDRLQKPILTMLDGSRKNLGPQYTKEKYPLIARYIEVTKRPALPGQRTINERDLARAERELKAMAWILKTTDDVYPEEEFLTSFDEKGHKENSEMLRELLDEYKRVYLKKR